jgi:hypothetical protein
MLLSFVEASSASDYHDNVGSYIGASLEMEVQRRAIGESIGIHATVE